MLTLTQVLIYMMLHDKSVAGSQYRNYNITRYHPRWEGMIAGPWQLRPMSSLFSCFFLSVKLCIRRCTRCTQWNRQCGQVSRLATVPTDPFTRPTTHFCLNGWSANPVTPKWRSRTSDCKSDSRFWIGKPGFLLEFPSNHTSISLSFKDIRMWQTDG